MMGESREYLSTAEQKCIGQAILELFNKYPELPVESIDFNKIIEDESTLSIYPLSEAVVLERYISGNYVGQYPFQVIYACRPVTTGERLDKQLLLESLSEWLEEGTAYPKLTDGRTIQEVYRTSSVTLMDRTESGLELYQITMNLKYRKVV
jgi:hypothetical protein